MTATAFRRSTPTTPTPCPRWTASRRLPPISRRRSSSSTTRATSASSRYSLLPRSNRALLPLPACGERGPLHRLRFAERPLTRPRPSPCDWHASYAASLSLRKRPPPPPPPPPHAGGGGPPPPPPPHSLSPAFSTGATRA